MINFTIFYIYVIIQVYVYIFIIICNCKINLNKEITIYNKENLNNLLFKLN